MKKICFVDYDMSIRGGVEQVTAALSSALAQNNEVHVLSLCQPGELAYALDPRVHYRALMKNEERLRHMRRKLKPLLSDYFNEHQIDVAIIQGNYPGFLTSTTRFSTKTKLVFCDHGALMNQWKQIDIRVIRWVASVLCHKVVTLTEQSRKAYISKFHLSKDKVSCIYNWIDLAQPRSEGYRLDSKRIISAGRFGKEKGFDMLVKAFAKVVDRHPDWTLDIYGDGEMMPVVQHLVKELHLENHVYLPGMRSDLAELYQNYAMYVLPSYREGMPLVLLEAKANRLPIVSFDIMTGPREILQDGVNGYLVEAYDLEDMADAICELIEDQELRRKMAVCSQKKLEKFDKKTILNQWQALIDQLAQ